MTGRAEPGLTAVVCPAHGAPLFAAPLGLAPQLVCRLCLEPVCESCERPVPLCLCKECDR